MAFTFFESTPDSSPALTDHVGGVKNPSGTSTFVNWTLTAIRDLLQTNFGAMQATSISFDSGTNTLDKFVKEAAWTPVIADAATGGNTATYSTQEGRVSRVGPIVLVSIRLFGINTSGMTSGNAMFLRGLPYPISAGAGNHHTGKARIQNITFGGSPGETALYGTTGNSYLQLVNNRSGLSSSTLTVGALTSGSASIEGSVAYITDAA